MKSISPLAPSMAGCCKTLRPAGSSTHPITPARPVRNTTAYKRRPLAQPSAAAMESSCGVSRFMGPGSRDEPRRLALVEEGLNAFLALVARTDVGDAAGGGVAKLWVDGQAGNLLHEGLARTHGPRSVGDDGGHDLVDFDVQFVGGTKRVHETERLRLRRTEPLGRHEIATRCLLAEGANHVRADRCRQETELRFAQAEVGGIRGDEDVAHRRQPHATGVAIA